MQSVTVKEINRETEQFLNQKIELSGMGSHGAYLQSVWLY